ncbi:hypothetical protein RB195_004848 [Necator americanus]|uniref:Secreted protein n=1 Tax=Necator americanus TaxID=51031 RepID=A0ABR1BJY5_NECAM
MMHVFIMSVCSLRCVSYLSVVERIPVSKTFTDAACKPVVQHRKLRESSDFEIRVYFLDSLLCTTSTKLFNKHANSFVVASVIFLTKKKHCCHPVI